MHHVLKLLGDATTTHFDASSLDDDLSFLQDLDLVYLGASPEQYQILTKFLREDYKHFNDRQYNSMRLKFLETFLNVLPCIYSTQKFRELFEETAKANITKEVEELREKV